MLETDEITKSLPPPRDDEPASLRQDIVDEIRDHMQCSLRRELLVGRGDETQARQRVLDRFGNPHVVARRLWFQAMWSKIMTQRLVIGSLVCSIVVSITLVVIVGLLMGRMDQQQRDQQAFNIALIEKMGSLMVPPVAAAPRDPNWNHLQIRMTGGTESGPPASGVQVLVSRQPRIGEDLPTPSEPPRSVIVDPSGLADCGDVPPGNYRVMVVTAWGERTNLNVTVKPGADHLERIIVPVKTPAPTKVSLQVEGIKPGPKSKHLLVARFGSCDRDFAGRSWTTGGEIFGRSIVLLAIDTNRRAWLAEIPMEMLTDSLYALPLPALVARANWSPLDSTEQISLPANRYYLSFVRVALNEDVSFDSPQWRSSIGSDTYDMPEKYNVGDWRWQSFTANAAEPNLWKIIIPNEIFEIDAQPSIPGTN
ncbi:MAG: hypothetical protein JWP89_2053 [Schlesneria sp.]|nr:hypothetical protein [Schlesneria sp.]